MKFLADMGISPRTVTWLKDQGHDAVRLSDEGLQRLPDADVMAKALAEKRILLTMDLGFGALLAMSRGQFPSTVIFRLSNETSKSVNGRLVEILDLFSADLESGAIISVSDETVRVRRLPL
jgi:predicted nuclease of predicted toxin-antitoxin system